jgi:hypothetical protein
MKYWLAIGLLLVCTIVRPNPLKTGGDHPTVIVEVQGRGVSLDTAKQDGFRKAIEQAVGSLVVSDTEASGAELVQDRIGNYSSGYVDNYKVLETTYHPDGYLVNMRVTVAGSKIAGRMTSRAEQVDSIDGDRLQAQMSTEFEQRAQGDQLIAQVLASYPEHAFVLNSGQTEFKITNRRTASIEIPFVVELSKTWVSALDEALGAVSKNSAKCSSWYRAVVNSVQNSKIRNRSECGATPDIRVGNNSYYFYDQETLSMVNAELQPTTGYQRIALNVDIKDSRGDTVDHRCADVNTSTFFKYNRPEGMVNVSLNENNQLARPDIQTQQRIKGVLNVNLANIRDFGEVAKIKLSVGRSCG